MTTGPGAALVLGLAALLGQGRTVALPATDTSYCFENRIAVLLIAVGTGPWSSEDKGGQVMRRTKPRVGHILETSLYVADLDRSRCFYERLFGFVAFFTDDRMCAMEVPGGQVLLLFRHGMTDQPAPSPGGTIPPHHGTGVLHLAFAIPFGEIDVWQDHLSEQEVALESIVRWQRGGTSLYFRDPDGHSLEVATPGLWPNW